MDFCASLESNICMANVSHRHLSLFQMISNEVRTDLWLSSTSDAEISVRLYVGFPSELRLISSVKILK